MNNIAAVNPEIIKILNDALKNEFIAIKQYWLNGFNLQYRGFERLAQLFLKEATGEGAHVELLTKRIFALGGYPTFTENEQIRIGDDIKEMLTYSLDLETNAIEKLKEGIDLTHAERDYVTCDMLTKILTDEEEHRLWLQTQLRLIAELNLGRYLEMMMTDCGSTCGKGKC